MMPREAAFDVAVVGSGGAGLVAACAAADQGLSVILLEATGELGGTTSLSGGQMWIPCSAPMARAGLPDSPAAAMAYLERLSVGSTRKDLLESFVTNGPRFVDYLEGELGVRLVSVPRPDYHPDWPGAATGRSLEPLPVPTEEIGHWRDRVRVSPARGPLTGTESREGIGAEELQRRKEAGIRTQGAGLVAGLVAAALRRNVRLTVGTRVTAAEDGGGAYRLAVDSEELAEVTARNVVLAAGGFARNPLLRWDFLPLLETVPTGPPGSMGDGLALGLTLGGHLHGMSEAWWTPAVSVPGETLDGEPFHRNIVRELAYPGSILVNADGTRFVDEASSYNDLGKAFLDFDAHSHSFPNGKAWMVFDASFKDARTVAGVPTQERPLWIVQAPDLKGLAQRAGIDPEGLERTVTAFNSYAENGTDPEFGRGDNAHDRFNGDESHRPNPCLGPVRQAPFFAVPVTLGANGTKGGLAVDAYSRVLGNDGNPIQGVFAVGETAAALMGPGYAGSGASLGPSLTAAYSISSQLRPPCASRPSPTPTGTTASPARS